MTAMETNLSVSGLAVRLSGKTILSDVTFAARPGKVCTIVGPNGSGKSTLLEMVCGTLTPTRGTVAVNGRLAALLELGAGFNPAFSGRENVYLNAALLGISKEEVHERFEDIVEFAGIGEFIEHPVSTYSSGMYVRLAFATAVNTDPEILIVDEALSVGDAYFQHKSFDRIRQYKASGTTLILVSHDRFAIQSICDRAILLQGGGIAQDGDPESVLDYYNASLSATPEINQQIKDGRTQTVSGDGAASVVSLVLSEGDHGPDTDVVATGDLVTLTATIAAHETLEQLVFGYAIRNRLGQDMYGINTFHTGDPIGPVDAGEQIKVRCRFPMNLGAGEYSIATAVVAGETHLERNHEWCDLAKVFTVINANKKAFTGCVWLEPEVAVEVVQ